MLWQVVRQESHIEIDGKSSPHGWCKLSGQHTYLILCVHTSSKPVTTVFIDKIVDLLQRINTVSTMHTSKPQLSNLLQTLRPIVCRYKVWSNSHIKLYFLLFNTTVQGFFPHPHTGLNTWILCIPWYGVLMQHPIIVVVYFKLYTSYPVWMFYYGWVWIYTSCLPFIDVGYLSRKKYVKFHNAVQGISGKLQGPVLPITYSSVLGSAGNISITVVIISTTLLHK